MLGAFNFKKIFTTRLLRVLVVYVALRFAVVET